MLAWRQIYFEWCLRVACPKKAICINSVFPLLLSMIIFRMSCFYVGRGMSYLTHVVDTRKKRLMLLCWFTTIKLNRKENASLVYIQLAAWWWQQTLWDRAWEKIRTLFCLQTAKKSIFPVLRKTNLHSPADHDEYDYCGWSYVAKYVNLRPYVLYNHPAKPLILLTMMLSK